MPAARQIGRRSQRPLNFRHEGHCRTVFLQTLRLPISEHVMEPAQPGVKRRLPRGGCEERSELIIPAAANLLLNAGHPGDVKVQHVIGPKRAAVRVAGVRVSRIHQHHRSRAAALPYLPVQIDTATVRDDANGERFVRVFAVTGVASVVNRTRLHKRKRVIAPECWVGSLSYRRSHAIRHSLSRDIEPCAPSLYRSRREAIRELPGRSLHARKLAGHA